MKSQSEFETSGRSAAAPRDIERYLAAAVALLGVVVTGAAITATLPALTPWLVFEAYAGPAALGAGVYGVLWTRMGQRGGRKSR